MCTTTNRLSFISNMKLNIQPFLINEILRLLNHNSIDEQIQGNYNEYQGCTR